MTRAWVERFVCDWCGKAHEEPTGPHVDWGRSKHLALPSGWGEVQESIEVQPKHMCPECIRSVVRRG